MIKNIIFGELYRNVFNESVEFVGPVSPQADGIVWYPCDTSAYNAEKVVDIILYNSVNRYGEKLTSMVFISGPRDADDTSYVKYNPQSLLKNNDFERGIVISDDENYRWLNKDILNTDNTLLKNTSFKISNPYARFDTTINYAPEVLPNKYMYDGWYTFMTLQPQKWSTSETSLPVGTLRLSATNALEYKYANGDWRSMNNIESEVPITNYLFYGNNPFITMDALILLKINTLYHDTILKKLSSDWFSGVTQIKPKITMLYNAWVDRSFFKAQHILNSVNISLLALNT